MKFGIIFANTGAAVSADGAVAMAQLAEESGFESLWTVEHVVVPADYQSPYPYSPTGKMPGGEESPIPDPLIWLSWVGAATKTIRLATGILILPQRNPLVLAKETATLDVLSGGRLTLGVGVGWLHEEFDALGIPWEHRGARTDEYIEALRVAWTEPEPTYQGKFVSFEKAKSYPKPANGAIPIAIGGHTEAAARRAGRLGDEFFPGVAAPDKLGGLIETMRAAAQDAGRDPAAIEVTAGGAMDIDGVKRMADLGVTRLVIPNFGRDPETWKSLFGSFADNVISKVGA